MIDYDQLIFRQKRKHPTQTCKQHLLNAYLLTTLGGAGSAQMQAGYVLQPKVDPQE